MKTAVMAAALGACWIGLVGAGAPPSLEQDVLSELNYVRAHPHEYADELRKYRSFFRGAVLYLPGDENGVVTREGPQAVDEAIDFLDRQQPLPPLDRGDVLALAAQDHADEQGSPGAMGHGSPDGASPGERVRRRGGDIYVGETIAYGASDAADVVRSFVIDDGVPSRGHRAAVFTSGYHFAGVGCGSHSRFGVICVVDYAGTATGAPVLPTAWKNGQTFTWRGSQGGVASTR